MELGEGPFSVRAVRLPRLAGTIGQACQPGRTFAHELAGTGAGHRHPRPATDPSRLRRLARLSRRVEELEEMRQAPACTPEDALVVVWGVESDTVTAAKEIQLRFADAIEGIPHETRQAFDDGSTDFERILPGPDRMYPDTDSPAATRHSRARTRPEGRICPSRLGNERSATAPPESRRRRSTSSFGVVEPALVDLRRRGHRMRSAASLPLLR